MVTTHEMMNLTGATFRQLDYWVKRGLLEPIGNPSGSGHYRNFVSADIQKVKLFVAISKTFGQTFTKEVMKDIYDNFSGGSIKFDSGLILMWPSFVLEV